ncbi:MAG TPA: DVUA0089 family protein [Myxococcota bacterium]|nr:DVUA0089 family protein [Myxococcota bacterium]
MSDSSCSAARAGTASSLVFVLLAALVASRPASAQVTSLSFTGSLATPTSVFAQSFVLSSPSQVTIQTWGFGGGTNSAGTVIAPGGFASTISLFSGVGGTATLVPSGANPAASAVTLTSFAPNGAAGTVTIGSGAGSVVTGDSRLVLGSLPAGAYTLVLTNSGYTPYAVNPGPPNSRIQDDFGDLTGGVFQTCNITADGTTTCVTPTANFAVDVVTPSAVLLSDSDGDGIADASDDCPTVANASQTDTDGDGVGDACDNCVSTPNPRVTPDAATFLTNNPWATLTGGQRDDDHDGYGNKCDAKFTMGPLVNTSDLTQFRASNGKNRTGDTCGTSGAMPCAIFDLDENGTLINTSDLTIFRSLNGKAPGPKCPTCPLPCTAGTAGTCN